jgi:hypothetical protein
MATLFAVGGGDPTTCRSLLFMEPADVQMGTHFSQPGLVPQAQNTVPGEMRHSHTTFAHPNHNHAYYVAPCKGIIKSFSCNSFQPVYYFQSQVGVTAIYLDGLALFCGVIKETPNVNPPVSRIGEFTGSLQTPANTAGFNQQTLTGHETFNAAYPGAPANQQYEGYQIEFNKGDLIVAGFGPKNDGQPQSSAPAGTYIWPVGLGSGSNQLPQTIPMNMTVYVEYFFD